MKRAAVVLRRSLLARPARRARREDAASSSRRGASSRWPRCRTSTSSSTWAIASRQLAFTDGAANPVRLESLLGRGKPVLVTLGYHRCPMLCGLVLDGLVKAARASGLKLGKDFLAVDVSIDPAEDAKLLDADAEAGAHAGGQRQPGGLAVLVVGRRRRRGGAASSPTRSASATSTTRPASSSRTTRSRSCSRPTGVVARYLYGVDYPARDFRMAVVEASGGRVGTSFDKVLLSCYRYDPATRRYAPFVMGFMRIGAGTGVPRAGRAADRPVA